MLKKLNIVNGIIQDKEIDGIPVFIKIINPVGKHNVRTLKKMSECIGITNHNTGNTNKGADDGMHARYFQNLENADQKYISAHLFVDENSITQIIPLDEVAYHAGDGHGDGNYKTIAVEICENGDLSKAESNAIKLNVALIMTYPKFKIFKHQDWSGKYCPRKIIPHWELFVRNIRLLIENNQVEQWKIDIVKKAHDKGLISDLEQWQEKVNDPMPVWAVLSVALKF